jgi:Uma2 family endonuclease
MGPLAEKQDERFTYGDYLKWDDGERWELIDGVAYNMTPAPSRFHQQVSMQLCIQFGNFLLNSPCKIYAAPFDVRLPEGDEAQEDVRTVVQPDITVVCDQSKLDDKGCKDSPDLIIEILSPSTARKDMKEKFLRYERAGVREYWIVDPSGKMVTVFKLSESGMYGRPDVYSDEDRVKVGILEGLEIELESVFRE